MMNNEGLIIRYDEFIGRAKRRDTLNQFRRNRSLTKKFRDTIILRYRDKELLERINRTFPFVFDFTKVDNMEIVHWPTHSKMVPHKDPGDRLSFIIYLNDDYEGGETIVDGLKIKPKKGRLIIFSNGLYEHSVNEITKGNRYTLIAWYK
tara:strand:+ start:129 stop:575 length:447 start_codon:yes stop_codon:yes gene_type:complete